MRTHSLDGGLFAAVLLLSGRAVSAAPDGTALCDRGGESSYKGEEGGLYGRGRNDPPSGLSAKALSQAALVRPLDLEGRSSPDGKVVFISIGMSNTTQEFSRFVEKAGPRNPLILVDGAQGAKPADAWNSAEAPTWDEVDRRLSARGLEPRQVQIAWIKQALPGPSRWGEFPGHARVLESELARVVAAAKARYPNLRLCYLSSRIYAGYATTSLNPEPYAYESAFAVRWLIQGQDLKDASSPVLLWGPYLWADGSRGRKADGLTWEPADFAPDGTHPSSLGREKVAGQLLGFFESDPYASKWFKP